MTRQKCQHVEPGSYVWARALEQGYFCDWCKGGLVAKIDTRSPAPNNYYIECAANKFHVGIRKHTIDVLVANKMEKLEQFTEEARQEPKDPAERKFLRKVMWEE